MNESVLAVRPNLLPEERWSEYELQELARLLEEDEKARILQDAEIRAKNNGFVIVPGECLGFFRKLSLRMAYKKNACFDVLVAGKRERYYTVAQGEMRSDEVASYNAYVERVAAMKVAATSRMK